MIHEIKTLQDILDCTDSENLDNFLIDFKQILKNGHFLRDLEPKVEFPSFTWIDDGKNDIQLIIKQK
jgi:hypothetical protein